MSHFVNEISGTSKMMPKYAFANIVQKERNYLYHDVDNDRGNEIGIYGYLKYRIYRSKRYGQQHHRQILLNRLLWTTRSKTI